MDILNLYFSSHRYFVTKHHLDSYNEFTNSTISKVISSMNPLKVIKNDESGNLHYEILMHIGGRNTDQLFFTKCVTRDLDGQDRLMYPNECRMKNKSYVCQLRATILVEYIDHKAGGTKIERTLENVFLCHIPIMLHSNLCFLSNQTDSILKAAGECPYDQGGYFIIDGKEKVVVAQERNVTNRLYISRNNDPPPDPPKETKTPLLNVGCRKEKLTYSLDPWNVKPQAMGKMYEAFIRCTSEKNSVFPKTFQLFVDRKNSILYARVPHINLDVPIFVLFRALGIETDKAIMDLIGTPFYDLLRPTLIKSHAIALNQPQALAWLSEGVEYKKHVENVMYILFEDFLPNVPDTLYEKAQVLGLLVKEMCEVVLNMRPESDRDNYMQKRVGVSGYLMGDIFKDFYNKFRVETRSKVDNTYEVATNHNTLEELSQMITDLNAHAIFGQSEDFQFGLIKSLKGNWGLSYDSAQQGIVQDLNRISYVGFLSHMRRVSAPMSDTAIKIRAPHQLGAAQWGYMCPCESPDGASIGLIKNMAVLNHVTSSADPETVMNALRAAGFEILPRNNNNNNVRLHLNNNWIGSTNQPKEIVEYIKLLRRNGYIDPMISISWNVIDNAINILTDSGRCTRPLLLISSPDFKKTKLQSCAWTDLVPKRSTSSSLPDLETLRKESHAALIEFIDVEESNTCLIAANRSEIGPFTTHCEIHPSTMFSVYSSTIPLANHNQAPRNVFSGAQGKQAIGVYATNYNSRIDTMSLVLHYPQRALVSTQYMDYLGINKLPNGENLIVAIASYTGYNQEDSIIINADSVARGMFNLTYYSTHVASEWIGEETSPGSFTECRFADPNVENIDITRFGNYTKIGRDGFPRLEERIEPDDCIVGKITRDVVTTIIGDPKTDIFTEKKERVTFKSDCDIADKTTSGTVNRVAVFDIENSNVSNAPNVRGVKVQLRQTREPELGDKMACYCSKTQVLTSRGWLQFDQLETTDSVASLDHENKLVYVVPTNIVSYEYNGEMYENNGDQLSFCVTPNHKMMIKQGSEWVLRRADECFFDLQGKRMLRGGTGLKEINSNLIDQSSIITYGLWLRYGLERTDGINWYFNEHPRTKHFEQYHVGRCTHVPSIFVDAKIGAFLSQVWTWNQEQARLLFDTIMDGDRVISRSECHVIAEMQRLALHAGASAFYSDEQCNIMMVGLEPMLFNVFAETVSYSGTVHCCETPNGILYVRRNGKALWCGNSRHGQKGVVGAMIPAHHMPFNKDGLVPDMIINPHAFPSRMTIGHLIECIMAKGSALSGTYADGTTFEPDNDENNAYNVLERHGYNRQGDEIMYNGITGEQMACEIFIGPTYYFRLKHMVADKINSRAPAKVVGLTQQPTKGRGNDGGLRVGEMETNVLIAHGISSFAKESMMERSDKCTVSASDIGMNGKVKLTQNTLYENLTKQNGSSIETVKTNDSIQIPFAFKLFAQEMTTLGVQPIVELDNGLEKDLGEAYEDEDESDEEENI